MNYCSALPNQFPIRWMLIRVTETHKHALQPPLSKANFGSKKTISKMKMTITTFAFVLLVSFFSTGSLAQQVTRDSTWYRPSIWGSAGLGISSLGFLSGLASVNVEASAHFVLSANATAESGSLIFSNSDVTSVNLLAGTILKQKYFLLALSAGLGYVNVYQVDPSSQFVYGQTVTGTNRSAVNIPVMAQGYFAVSPGFGLGLGGYLNLNSIKTTTGLVVSIAFGSLGTRKGSSRHKHPKLF